MTHSPQQRNWREEDKATIDICAYVSSTPSNHYFDVEILLLFFFNQQALSSSSWRRDGDGNTHEERRKTRQRIHSRLHNRVVIGLHIKFHVLCSWIANHTTGWPNGKCICYYLLLCYLCRSPLMLCSKETLYVPAAS